MRALIGLLILGSLFVMAASWQNRTTSQLRDRRAQRYGIPSDSIASPAGWSRLVLGRPSGAEPLALPELPPDFRPADDVNDGPTDPVPGPDMPALIPADFAYTVHSNDVLGTICQKHYDVRPLARVVRAVATYNDLSSQDAIRSGDVILLPDATVLFGPR